MALAACLRRAPWRHGGSGGALQRRLRHDLRFQYSREVAQALRSNSPIVALESTIISHGMPFPENARCAAEVEGIVREHGATPATIAIIDGVPHIGLEPDQLQEFAALPPDSVRKCSRRDLAVSIALGESGATTVAGTMILAKRAGIDVFVTGGVGGVHRGAFDNSLGGSPTLDVSADLTELARTGMAVVCAGCKSILDLPHTLEFLETQGVTVATLGQANLPAFFTADSGIRSPLSLNSVQDAARAFHASKSILQLGSGMLLTVPNPSPMDQGEHDRALATALQEAVEQGVTGKASTPFLLSRLNELTGGVSLQSNVALIKNNARVGAELAVHSNRLARTQSFKVRAPAPQAAQAAAPSGGESLLVVGGAAIDITATPTAEPHFHTSNPGRITESLGGVARNVAECAANLRTWFEALDHVETRDFSVRFLTAIGNDSRGRSVLERCAERGVDTSLVRTFDTARTATYCSITDREGDLLVSVADMDVFDRLSSFELDAEMDSVQLLLIDANMPHTLVERLSREANEKGAAVMFEPVSMAKGCNSVDLLRHFDLITPNRDEVSAMANVIKGSQRYAGGSVQEDARLIALEMHVPGQVKHVLVTCGDEGVLEVTCSATGEVHEHMHAALPVAPESIVSANGAGDSLAGGLAWSLVARRTAPSVKEEMQGSLAQHLARGLAVSALALQTRESVPTSFPTLSHD